jgi:hypothetical protein
MPLSAVARHNKLDDSGLALQASYQECCEKMESDLQ